MEKDFKEMSMNAKLNDKAVLQLEKGKGHIDKELGMATPFMALKGSLDSTVKQEFPSLSKLQELSKSVKTSQLHP